MWVIPRVSQEKVALVLLADRPSLDFFATDSPAENPVFQLLLSLRCVEVAQRFVYKYQMVQNLIEILGKERERLLRSCHNIAFEFTCEQTQNPSCD